MAENTAISWADHTWNPWIGCTKVSPACDGCYAEALMDKRMGRVKWGGPGVGVGDRIRTGAHTWNDPARWQRRAEAEGTRPFVFCASLADIFDNKVDLQWRADAFAVMRATPRLVYLLLTKRPQNIAWLAHEAGGLPSNAAIGATVEDQPRADNGAFNLSCAAEELEEAGTPPLFVFLSCEPLLGPINFGSNLIGIDWVITGGETDQGGHAARPSDPDWFRSIRDQCAADGVAYHHKQNGEWLDGVRVSKRHSGRQIDGVTHDARPSVAEPA